MWRSMIILVTPLTASVFLWKIHKNGNVPVTYVTVGETKWCRFLFGRPKGDVSYDQMVVSFMVDLEI
jgi:hypothetical protein